MGNPDPILLSLNDKPRTILQVMDNLMSRHENQKARSGRRRWIPLLLFFAGFPFLCLDPVLGYGQCLFSLVSIGFWVAAVATFIVWLRGRPGADFPPLYKTTRQVIYTLRDDLAPKQNFLGQLDLTGPQQKSKLAREGKNAVGLTVNFYRDEWLSLKGKLYDGNRLRLSAINRVKVRIGYSKRSRISGKMKWKPPKIANQQELQVKIAVNPEAYEITPMTVDARNAQSAGQYYITALNTSGGIVQLTAATSAAAIQPEDVLSVLRFGYNLLKRKGQK